MSLDSYANLRTSVALRLGNRSDLITSGVIDEAIDLCETEANVFLRHHRKEAQTTLTCNSSGKATLPTDFLEVRSARYTGSPNVELTPISVGAANRLSPFDTSGAPGRHYDISGTTFSITPISSASVTLTYDQKVPPLSASTGSTINWLLTLAPNYYLYGTMAHAMAYTRDFQDAQVMQASASGILDGINEQAELAAYKNAEITLDGMVTDDYSPVP